MPVSKLATASNIGTDDDGAESGWFIVGGLGYFFTFIFIYAFLEDWRQGVFRKYKQRKP